MSIIVRFINLHQLPLYKTINAINRAKIIDAFHFMERQFNLYFGISHDTYRETQIMWHGIR